MTSSNRPGAHQVARAFVLSFPLSDPAHFALSCPAAGPPRRAVTGGEEYDGAEHDQSADHFAIPSWRRASSTESAKGRIRSTNSSGSGRETTLRPALQTSTRRP